MPTRTTTRWVAATAGCLIAITAIGACTSSSGGGSGSDAAAPAAAAPKAAYGEQTKPSARAGNAADGHAATSAGDLDLSSAKIRTADMTVAIKHGESVAAKADQAETIALRTGGEVDSDDRTSGKDPTASLLLRVPPEELSPVLHDLSALGIENSRHMSTRDVTSKVADVTSRVASARDAIARLRVLYHQAVKVADVITIEGELASRESDLEALEAQQRALTAQTSMAAITLSLYNAPPAHKRHVPPPPQHHRSGFVGGLENGWEAFAAGAAWVATAVGTVLPFLALLVVVGLLIRWLWPRLRRQAPAQPQ
jgi:hypothetical protein